jgi:DNA-binding SARP family transcriptional activator
MTVAPSEGYVDVRPVPRARVSPPRLPALPRERLRRILDRVWDHRVGLLVAPAGSGKTTLLAHFAAASTVPVAWYRAEAGDADPSILLRALARSLSSVVGERPREPAYVEDLIAALEAWPGERALLVVDDLDTLAGAPAEAALERLLEYAPPSLHVLLASRYVPGFNLSRLRVSGKLLELGADDLRFRSWEVEELFRNFYEEPLPPEDLAELARRTEGWAAGLQLFHLATRGRPTGERRRMVAELGSRSRMVREYLARNVLDQLSDDLRTFLLGTCVLGRLTGPLCDELLDRSDSGEILRALERQQIFTVVLNDDGVYRYHEVLRTHLELALVEQVGEAEAKQRYFRAGRLLHRAGAAAEALRAYCRAEAWAAVAGLLGRDGRRLANGHGSWPDVLPARLSEHDPWVLLAQARRKVALGRLTEAVGVYDEATRQFGSTSAAHVCRRERQAVALWLETSRAPRADWMCLLRAATQHDPVSAARDASRLPGATGRFTVALATLLAGHVEEARCLLAAAAELSDMPPVMAVVARLLATMLALATGNPGAERLPDLHDAVEALDVPWLTRLCRSMAVLLAARNNQATPIPIADRHDSDPWGAALVSLLDGALRIWDGRPAVEAFEEAALGFRRLGAGVAETWARSGLALALAGQGHPDAHEAAVAAVRWARSAGVPSAEAPALLALGLLAGDEGSEYLALARSVAEQGGMRLPPIPPSSTNGALGTNGAGPEPSTASPAEVDIRTVAPVTLRCFGGFALHLGDRVVDCRGLKPRPRAALHLLALHAGRAVHRETLLEALWPEVDATTGTRNLHVAISTIRRFLEPDAGRGTASLVVRDADAYRLALPPDAAIDLWTFDNGLAGGRAAQAAGDESAAIDALERVLDVYTGELLPEAGPAEWVVMAREQYRMQASEATLLLTELHLSQGDPARAVAVAERGLAIDRYRDAQWRQLITACEMAGDRAAAARVRRSYDEMLGELGLAPNGSSPG